jgi:signal transduction histidine kinase
LALTEEHERHRIASELDSRVSQSLAVSKSKLDMLSRSVAGEELRNVLSEISRSLGKMITDAMLLSSDLSSPLLYDLGLEAAVAQWLSDEIEKKCGIETEFTDDGQIKPLNDDVRILVFRDVRELLGNVAKHSHATKVRVSIDRVGRRIRIAIEDDGVGFDPVQVASRAAARSEFGLFGIHAKLAHLGGHLEIKSAPGCGCKVTITAPLKRENAAKSG